MKLITKFKKIFTKFIYLYVCWLVDGWLSCKVFIEDSRYFSSVGLVHTKVKRDESNWPSDVQMLINSTMCANQWWAPGCYRLRVEGCQVRVIFYTKHWLFVFHIVMDVRNIFMTVLWLSLLKIAMKYISKKIVWPVNIAGMIQCQTCNDVHKDYMKVWD